MANELRHGAQPERDHRRPRGQGLDDREPEGLGEADEVEEREGTAQQRITLDRLDRSRVGDAFQSEVWLHEVTEVGPVLHDPRDDQWKAGPACDLDRQVRPLVRVDAAEEEEVAPRLRPKGEGGQLDAVVDGRCVAQIRVAVRVADCDVVADVVVRAVDRQDALGREAMDGRHDRGRDQAAVGQWHEVELVRHHVELLGSLEGSSVVEPLVRLRVDAQILLVATRGLGVQVPRRDRVGGREQGYLMAEGNKPLAQRGRHLLPRPVAARRCAMRDRGDHPDSKWPAHATTQVRAQGPGPPSLWFLSARFPSAPMGSA